MKEQFRTWNPKGTLKVKYRDNQGQQGTWEIDQQTLLAQIILIVKTYQAQGIMLTNRQLYYRLVSGDGGAVIPNSEETYKRVCKFLTDARYAGLLDWDAIEDRGRTPERHSQWDSVSDLIRSAVYGYRLPRWADQEYYVELYCEKQAMESILQPIANKWHIYFGANKGYSSASTMYELAQRIKAQINDGKKTVILYLGDHDPSGLDMVRDVKDRVIEFLTEGEAPIDEDVDEYFQVKQLALNINQIRQYNPPPNPAKITDPRAKWYLKEHGNKSWELDSLKPEILTRIAEKGILEFVDQDAYDAIVMTENNQKKALEIFGKKLEKQTED